jgi:hypothetical protein
MANSLILECWIKNERQPPTPACSKSDCSAPDTDLCEDFSGLSRYTAKFRQHNKPPFLEVHRMSLMSVAMLFLQDTPPDASASGSNTVKLISGVLAVILVVIIIMRRKGKGSKKEDDEF